MTSAIDQEHRRDRLLVDLDPSVHDRLLRAASTREVSVQQYVVEAIEERLREDDGTESATMTATTDPVLARLWDNPYDAAYDRLPPR